MHADLGPAEILLQMSPNYFYVLCAIMAIQMSKCLAQSEVGNMAFSFCGFYFSKNIFAKNTNIFHQMHHDTFSYFKNIILYEICFSTHALFLPCFPLTSLLLLLATSLLILAFGYF